MATLVKVVYEDSEGNTHPTYEEALLSSALSEIEGLYLEGYRKERIVQGLVKVLDFKSCEDVE